MNVLQLYYYGVLLMFGDGFTPVTRLRYNLLLKVLSFMCRSAA